MSKEYWTDPQQNGGPVCAFLNTTDDRFIDNVHGEQIFSDIDDFENHKYRDRLLGLLPEGFFG